MAEPARRIDDDSDVYDQRGMDPSNPKPDLKTLERGPEAPDSRNARQSESSDNKPSREDLADAEENPEPDKIIHENQIGQGYRPSAVRRMTGNRLIRIFFGSTRRTVLTGGTTSLIIAGIIFLLSIVSGPLQFIHLSQILQRNFWGQEHTATIRAKGLFRYARTKDIGETRVGYLGSKRFAKAYSQLKDIGVEFDRNTRTGAARSMTIDTDKYPDYKDMASADRRGAIIRDFKITDASILSQEGSVFRINLTSLKGIDFSAATLKTVLSKLDKGKLATAMDFRVMKRFFNLPRLFSPLEKIAKSQENQIGERLAARQAEEERLKSEAKAVTETPEALKAREKMKDLLKNKATILNAALIGQATLCLIRSVADDAVTFNRAAIVLPATLQAVDRVAVGSQVQSGQNFSIYQLGAISDSFKDDSGKTIWASKALQATEGISSPKGEELDPQFAEAFSNKTTADNIRKAVEVKAGPIDVTGAVCSKAGLIVAGTLALFYAISGFFDAGVSWGAYAAQYTATAIATAGIMYMLQQQFSNIIQNHDVIPQVLSGPLGGNLLAYGAREAGNIGARANGGIELDNTESDVVDNLFQQEDAAQFRSLSLKDRLFNVYDHRTLAAKFIDSTSPNLLQQFSRAGSIFTGFSSHLISAFSGLVPRAQAASTGYNWGFPKYGIPTNLAEDQKYEDPYDNADDVAKILDSGAGDGWMDKAKKCFGVNIVKDSTEKWAVIAESDVNPGSTSYTGADCNDGDESWRKIMLFVFDSRLMDAISCYEADDDSCGNLDIGSATTTSSTSTSGTVSGTVQQLARQILNNKNISYPLDSISQNGSTKEVLQALASGKLAPVTCTNNTTGGVTSTEMDPKILQFVLDLGNQTKVGVNALTDKCHSAGSNHYQGEAVDFECQGISFNVSLADSLAAKYGIKRNSETCSVNNHWHYSTNGA